MTEPRLHRLARIVRRSFASASLVTLATAPLGVALAHERLKPTLDETARASGVLLETLRASAPPTNSPRARILAINGARFALTTTRSLLPPREAADQIARSCSERFTGALGAAFGGERGAVAACIMLDSGFSARAEITFAQPLERGAALLLVESLDARSLTDAFATGGSVEHLPGIPRPVGQLTLGAALDGTPLLALYRAPHAQLTEMQERLEALGAHTRRGGTDALYATLRGGQYLLVQSATAAESRLVVLRLPD